MSTLLFQSMKNYEFKYQVFFDKEKHHFLLTNPNENLYLAGEDLRKLRRTVIVERKHFLHSVSGTYTGYRIYFFLFLPCRQLLSGYEKKPLLCLSLGLDQGINHHRHCSFLGPHGALGMAGSCHLASILLINEQSQTVVQLAAQISTSSSSFPTY